MTPTTTVLAGALALPLALVLLIIILLGGGAGGGSAQLTSAVVGTGGSFNSSAVPNQAWVPWIEQAGSLCPDITAPVIAAQDQVESSWNPNAISPAGALGIAQFEPGTWPAYDTPPAVAGPDTAFNVPDAIMAQGRYDCALVGALGSLAQQTGIPVLTLALDAYNAGLDAVVAAGGIPGNPQTEQYAPQIEQLAATTYAATGSSPAGPGTGATGFASAEIAAAQAEIGLPYVYGGGTDTGPSGSAVAPPGYVGQPGFDCSGLVLYAVYQASGGKIALPHLSEAQVTMGQQVAVGQGSQVLASGLLEPGDLIGFFNLDADNAWDHIGIYVGNGQMIDAPETGQLVQVTNLATSYWESVDWNVRRLS